MLLASSPDSARNGLPSTISWVAVPCFRKWGISEAAAVAAGLALALTRDEGERAHESGAKQSSKFHLLSPWQSPQTRNGCARPAILSGATQSNLLRSAFSLTHDASHAFLSASFAFGAAPACMNPWPAPSKITGS